MSSPIPDGLPARLSAEDDDRMQGSGQEGEGEEEDVGIGNVIDDSSEEEEEDEEEARRVTEGFIVGDEEDEEDEEVEGPKKRRKRRKKHHHRGNAFRICAVSQSYFLSEEILEDDDLELMEENTGSIFKKKSRLAKLRDLSRSPASSKRLTIIESSDDDLEMGERPRVVDISKIWDDRDEDEDIDDFIEYSDEDVAPLNQAAREARREEKRQELRRKRAQVRPELVGIDAKYVSPSISTFTNLMSFSAWDELHEVFGDGNDYEWALVGDDYVDREEEQYKSDIKYYEVLFLFLFACHIFAFQLGAMQVFEPSEIKKRKLTDDDDLIRAMDTPERMQLATSSLSETSTLSLHTQLTEDDIGGAAMWVSQRLPPQKKEKFFAQDGIYRHLNGVLVMAVTFVLRQLFIDEYEVPYIWTHKRDYISYFDTQTEPQNDPQREPLDLLELEELWLVYALGQKYRSLLERRRALATLYQRLQVRDAYYDEDIEPQLDSVEIVADATEWLSMKYKDKKHDHTAEFRFHDDEEPELEKKRKMPSRVSAYEVAKKTIVVKVVEVRTQLDWMIILFIFLSEIWTAVTSNSSKLQWRASCPLCG